MSFSLNRCALKLAASAISDSGVKANGGAKFEFRHQFGDVTHREVEAGPFPPA